MKTIKSSTVATRETLYAIANQEMRRLIRVYLELTKATQNLGLVTKETLKTEDARRILLAGIGSDLDPVQTKPGDAAEEWKRRQAIPFDLETSITTGVYISLKTAAEQLYDELHTATSGFTEWSSEYICDHPVFLPIVQHVAGLFSKAQLKRLVGSVSDTGVSRSAADRLIVYLKRFDPTAIRKGEVLKRLDSTLEGIVRDLVGRVLLESVVANALEIEKLSFLREKDYPNLTGVVYDFRADFLIPDYKNPKVFIEVRKSSTRHASLYAKDKMFSAINWKGRHKELLGVLVVDGPWTTVTLRTMARVFDYVVPLGKVAELAKTISAYVTGDKTKLKWLIEFRIQENSP